MIGELSGEQYVAHLLKKENEPDDFLDYEGERGGEGGLRVLIWDGTVADSILFSEDKSCA